MVKSYFDTNLLSGREYCLNHYRIRKIRDKILLTTDHGGWVCLEKKEYDSLIRFELSEELFEALEEKGIILTKNNSKTISNLLLQRLHYLFNGASLHIIIPTLKCNHCCVYCHSASKKKDTAEYDLDRQTAKDIVNFIFQSPAKSITIEFQGGESLLNFEIVKFIVIESKLQNIKANKHLRFTIVTNLTLLDDPALSFIREHKLRLCTSLDGPSFIHDKNRLLDDGLDSYS
ncbi:4Fe-4S cluster-binding domain-containing protein, partial [Candidatus Woesearchaeota archaeon]|nr:4Fe-4S cluster-binding domain-containing protein [Candidatus Woesearchaeota archaeon]